MTTNTKEALPEELAKGGVRLLIHAAYRPSTLFGNARHECAARSRQGSGAGVAHA